jgi:DNA-binding response OmpR family regulator
MAGELILLVDDEPSIVQLAQMYLEKDGFQVESVGDGNDALAAAREVKPALIVLDVMLPGVDGFEVCRQLRAEDNPVLILMLTARDEDIDKIVGLELGADDYMTKPFNPRELVARVKAMLRRVSRPAPAADGEVIRLADIVIDPARREVRVSSELIDLRTQEFDLLVVLAENKGIVLTREKLLNMAWGYDYFGQTRTVDVHIAHLRKKLSKSETKIETITGVGYKLVVG